MISAVVPTWQAESRIGRTLSALRAAPVISEIVVADGGSTDATRALASAAGCRVVAAPRGRGTQLAAGAAEARNDWLLFLHADTVPETGWTEETAAFVSESANKEVAAVFRFALDDGTLGARLLERGVAWRCSLFALPYGDQGLLIHRALYDRIGGFRPIPLFEDVDIVRRIGRRRLRYLETPAVTSAERYRRGGYLRRPLRNLACLTLYFLGLPPATIRRIYG